MDDHGRTHVPPHSQLTAGANLSGRNTNDQVTVHAGNNLEDFGISSSGAAAVARDNTLYQRSNTLY